MNDMMSDEETFIASYGSIRSSSRHLDDIETPEARHDGTGIKSMQVNQIGDRSEAKRKQLLLHETKAILKLALPVAASYFLDMLPGIVTIALVGRSSSDCAGQPSNEVNDEANCKIFIDSTAFAMMLLNFLALYTGIGLLTAMDTLCSQAYGASKSHRIGSYAVTATVIMFFTFLTVSFVIIHSSKILVFLGQPHEVAKSASLFAHYLLPGVPFIYGYEILRKILQAKNDASPLVIAALVNNAINICAGFYLVHYTAWGWLGAAVAKTLGNVSLIPTLLITLRLESRSENEKSHYFQEIWGDSFPWESFCIDSFSEFLGLGIPGMFQLVFEWWAWEAVALLCGLLPGKQGIIGIGANAIMLNITSMTYMLYLGVSVAGSVRIGNALGNGNCQKAEVASHLALALSSAISIMNVIVLLLFRFQVPHIFTSDEGICEKVSRLLCIGAVFQLPDAVYGSVQGIFRGSGRHALGAKLNFIAYYCIGIPLGYFLGLRLGYGVEGLWTGMTVGLVSVSVCGLVCILKSNRSELAYYSKEISNESSLHVQ